DLTARQFDLSAIKEVQVTLRTASRAEWMARFADRDVCVEPSLTLEESEEDWGGLPRPPQPRTVS
ncbi:MAG TPA: hypothetical protein VIJ03_03350, partial [Candidatus Dormibacteraeota bacterium]